MFSRVVAAVRIAIPVVVLAAMALVGEAGMRWGA
jgi:hypothetical protein